MEKNNYEKYLLFCWKPLNQNSAENFPLFDYLITYSEGLEGT